jgi:hypothetical protein
MSCLSVSTFFGRVKVDCKEESRCFSLSAHLLYDEMLIISGRAAPLLLVSPKKKRQLQVGSCQRPFHVEGLGDAAEVDC